MHAQLATAALHVQKAPNQTAKPIALPKKKKKTAKNAGWTTITVTSNGRFTKVDRWSGERPPPTALSGRGRLKEPSCGATSSPSGRPQISFCCMQPAIHLRADLAYVHAARFAPHRRSAARLTTCMTRRALPGANRHAAELLRYVRSLRQRATRSLPFPTPSLALDRRQRSQERDGTSVRGAGRRFPSGCLRVDHIPARSEPSDPGRTAAAATGRREWGKALRVHWSRFAGAAGALAQSTYVIKSTVIYPKAGVVVRGPLGPGCIIRRKSMRRDPRWLLLKP